MRSNEERVAAVKRRVAQIERQKRQRRNRIAALSAVAACLVVIMGASFATPDMKWLRAYSAAALPPAISSLDFCPLCWACA